MAWFPVCQKNFRLISPRLVRFWFSSGLIFRQKVTMLSDKLSPIMRKCHQPKYRFVLHVRFPPWKGTYFVICLPQLSSSPAGKWGRTKEGSTYWSGLTCARGGTSLSQISKAATASIGQWTPTRKVQEGSWEAKDFDWWYANCLGKGVAWSKIRGRWYYICSFLFLSTPYLFNNIDIWQ